MAQNSGKDEKTSTNCVSVYVVEQTEKRKSFSEVFYKGTLYVKDMAVMDIYCNQPMVGEGLTTLEKGTFGMLTNVIINTNNIKTTEKTKVCFFT